jgi:hypothetical protein
MDEHVAIGDLDVPMETVCVGDGDDSHVRALLPRHRPMAAAQQKTR